MAISIKQRGVPILNQTEIKLGAAVALVNVTERKSYQRQVIIAILSEIGLFTPTKHLRVPCRVLNVKQDVSLRLIRKRMTLQGAEGGR